jgi:hypothetical protein
MSIFLKLFYIYSFKNLEKEQKSILFSRKNESNFANLYEIFIANDSNQRNESKFMKNFHDF